MKVKTFFSGNLLPQWFMIVGFGRAFGSVFVSFGEKSLGLESAWAGFEYGTILFKAIGENSNSGSEIHESKVLLLKKHSNFHIFKMVIFFKKKHDFVNHRNQLNSIQECLIRGM